MVPIPTPARFAMSSSEAVAPRSVNSASAAATNPRRALPSTRSSHLPSDTPNSQLAFFDLLPLVATIGKPSVFTMNSMPGLRS